VSVGHDEGGEGEQLSLGVGHAHDENVVFCSGGDVVGGGWEFHGGEFEIDDFGELDGKVKEKVACVAGGCKVAETGVEVDGLLECASTQRVHDYGIGCDGARHGVDEDSGGRAGHQRMVVRGSWNGLLLGHGGGNGGGKKKKNYNKLNLWVVV